MVGMKQGLAGRNVYGQGSFAPTRGRVSAQGAQGYLKRELRKPAPKPIGNRGIFGGVSTFGRDGQSDTRSGVAKRALQRKGSPGKTNQAVFNNQGRQTAQSLIKGATNLAGSSQTPPGGIGQSGYQTVNPPVAQPQSVTVNNAGQLELPYSEEYSAQLLGQMGQYNQDLAQLQIDEQNASLAFQRTKRDSEQNYGDLKRQTLSGNAARGTAYSSAYGYAAGTNERNFNTFMNDLSQDYGNQQAGFQANRTGIMASFQDQLRQDALLRAQEAADSAGELGYGTYAPQTSPGQNSSAAKNKPRPKPPKKKPSGGSVGGSKPPKKGKK